MTNYWKSKLLPKIKKVFEKNSVKKAAATEATKVFDDSKEVYNKEFEEKKTDLQPKVVEIYEATSTEIKSLIKEPKDAGLKKHSAEVQKLLEDLANIEFPGSKPVAEACSKFGAAYVSGPVLFVFEKVSTFVVTEDKKEETEEAPAAPTTEEATTTTTTTEIKEKEIVIEEEKKEEAPTPAPAPAPEKTEAPAPEPATTEPAKVEEAPAAPAPVAPAAETPPAAPAPAVPVPAAEPAKP